MAKDKEQGEQGAAGDKPQKAEKAEKHGEKKAQGKKGEGKGEGKASAKAEVAPKVKEPKRIPRLKTYYEKEVIGALTKQFSFKNQAQVPRLTKIVINMGLGEAVANPKILESAEAEMTAISGRKPVITRAKKSIATYKLRAGMPIGCMVTLRREAMWEFLDRLVNVALPRVRDFRGVSPKGFDGMGNFAMGIKEQIIFPEIDYDKIDKIKGMNVCIVTTAETDEESRALLGALGMPFRKK